MVHQAINVVVMLALLMAVVTGSAGASVLTNIGTAQISGGGGTNYNLIYDSDQSLFWLDYTQGYDTWQNQVNWANNLILTNVLTPGYIINFSEAVWRLPTTISAVSGYNQNGSEMGHLYYTGLGLTQGTQVNAGNQGPFTNILQDWYWSGTEYAINPDKAWAFDTYDGLQYALNKVNHNYYALAVRPGQLSTSAVPEPSTYVLLSIGLGVVGYARRRMSAR